MFSINAVFTETQGKWDTNRNEYTDIKSKAYARTLKVKFLPVIAHPYGEKWIIYFEGGPTGFESYYVNDGFVERLENAQGERLPLCVGTINRYAECTVLIADVLEIIKQCRKETNEYNAL